MDKINLVELGPRDGLQNEKLPLPVETKVALINRLVDAGFKTVEAGAFVSPKRVPQMANSGEVLSKINRPKGVSFPVLAPNIQGYEAAKESGADTIAVFASASETFSQRNINCSIKESLSRFKAVIDAATKDGIRSRGYISNVLGCPYEGKVSTSTVIELSKKLLEMGCYEISLCDTIGVGTPLEAKQLIRDVKSEIPVEKIAGHFHDTYGQALANSFIWLEEGVRTFDSSISGLGGCPFAEGASGNLATEDLVYGLEGSGLDTSVNLEQLIEISRWISGELNKQPASHVTAALQSR